MSAARDLALWVKEHADTAMSEELRLADLVLKEEKSLADRAFEMWLLMASTGEYRIGPSAKDIVRTARAMLYEVENPSVFPEPVVGRGRLEPPTPKDELDLGEY